MSRLTKDNPNARELVTGILDEELWWNTLKLVVEFLRAKAVEEVRVEFGFVRDRDLAGKEQGKNRTVRLADLEGYIRSGIEEGTIERKGPQTSFFILVVRNLRSCFATTQTFILLLQSPLFLPTWQKCSARAR